MAAWRIVYIGCGCCVLLVGCGWLSSLRLALAFGLDFFCLAGPFRTPTFVQPSGGSGWLLTFGCPFFCLLRPFGRGLRPTVFFCPKGQNGCHGKLLYAASLNHPFGGFCFCFCFRREEKDVKPSTDGIRSSAVIFTSCKQTISDSWKTGLAFSIFSCKPP